MKCDPRSAACSNLGDGIGVSTPCQGSLITDALSDGLARVIEALEFFSDSNPNWSLSSAV